MASAVIFVGAAEVAARHGRQAAGIAFGGVGFGIALTALLPAFSTVVAPLVCAAAIFGATFMGIALLTMRVVSELSDGAAALLTAAYAVGQMFGPVLVAPVIGDGYPVAFVIATAVLIAATVAAISVTRQLRRT